jgi:hypothetical protein
VQRPQPRRIGSGELRVGHQREVDRIARHQPHGEPGRGRDEDEGDRDLHQAAEDEAEHRGEA